MSMYPASFRPGSSTGKSETLLRSRLRVRVLPGVLRLVNTAWITSSSDRVIGEVDQKRRISRRLSWPTTLAVQVAPERRVVPAKQMAELGMPGRAAHYCASRSRKWWSCAVRVCSRECSSAHSTCVEVDSLIETRGMTLNEMRKEAIYWLNNRIVYPTPLHLAHRSS